MSEELRRFVSDDVRRLRSASYNYAAPVVSLPGRNGLGLNLVLYYNSAIWTIDSVNNTATFNADRDFPSYGFRLGFGEIEGPMTNSLGTQSYILTEPDGAKRELRFSSGTLYATADSSYVDFNSSTLALRRKNGTQWLYQQVGTSTIYRPTQIKDTNGNFISITYRTDSGFNAQAINTIIDTVGRTITFNYDSNGGLLSVTGPAPNPPGGTRTYASFTWGTVTLNYSFTPSLPVKDTLANGSAINVITACTYPANGTGYSFSYGGWGIVSTIQRLSANGTVRSSVAYNYPSGSTTLSAGPTYSQQTVFDGVNTGNWGYVFIQSGDLVSSAAITDPSGTTTTTNLYTSGWQTGLVSSIVVKSGSTTLRTVSNTWTQDNISVNYITNPRLSSVSVTLNDTGQATSVQYSYDSYGNVTLVDQWDYSGLLLQQTQTTYLTDPNYLNRHILDRPLEVQSGGGLGAPARTDLAYDNYGVGGLTAVPGASNHDDSNYGSNFTYRGNATSVTRYTNASDTTTGIANSFTYDTLGNVLTAQVNCCQQEQFAFTSNTQYAYPETIIRGPSGTQLTARFTYDIATGLTLASTDENGQTTTFTYDAMNRATSVKRPDNALFTYAYDDNSASPGATATSPIDSSNSLAQVTTTDGLGRVLTRVTKDASQATYSTIQAQYDALGRPIQLSNPYGPSETPVWTATSYDALGRVATVTPPGSAGSYQYSYSGNSVTVTDPASKQRRTFSDALGRIVTVYEPGYDDGAGGSGSVTINGTEQSVRVNPCAPSGQVCWQTIYDTGSVSIAVGGSSASAAYGRGSTATSVASALAQVFNTSSGSPVTATVTGSTISLVAKMTGPQTNYTLSASSGTGDPADFSGPSFTTSPSGSALTGGVDGSGNDGHPPSINSPLVTIYTYDWRGNLLVSTQGAQQRSFAYDGLGRLTSASTPEAGTVSSTYNSFGLVTQRTDPRGVQTNYAYDGLNRLNTISYTVPSGVPATPTVTFGYDAGGASANALGRLTSMSDGVGGETYQYDLLGRVTALTKTIGSSGYPLGYQYNTAGELTYLNYPSGRQVQQQFDAIGRLKTIQNGGTNVFSQPAYTAAGAPANFTYGNGVQAAFSYNAQMQLASLAYSNGSGAFFSLGYNYGSGDNGQIQTVTDNVDSTKTNTYTYDAWGRLKTAQNAQWGLSWTYDRYGNRKTQTVTGGGGPSNQLTINAATNQATDPGYGYDASGNMTADGLNALTYDAENRVVTNVQGGQTTNYSYDGNSLRVQKQVVNGTTTVYIFSGSKVIAEYENGAAPLSPTREYVYAGTQLLAKIEAGTTQYYHGDHLSVRAITDSSGTVIGQHGHYPFGETWYDTGVLAKEKLTTYERDIESNNDYAVARTFVNRLGRFSSLDPLAGSVADPQSLNRYAYALNDPINLFDPLGLKAPIFAPTPWGGLGCTLDGFAVSCAMVASLVNIGFASIPPDGPGWEPGVGGWKGSGCFVNRETDQGIVCPDPFTELGGNPDKWWRVLGFQDDPTMLVLVTQSDCQDSNGRHTLYDLQTTSGDPVQGKYEVTEHQSNTAVTPAGQPAGPGTTTQINPNAFDDNLSPQLQFGVINSIQYFTVSPGSPDKSPGYPVGVRNAQGKFATLSIYMSQFRSPKGGSDVTILVNRKAAPPCKP